MSVTIFGKLAQTLALGSLMITVVAVGACSSKPALDSSQNCVGSSCSGGSGSSSGGDDGGGSGSQAQAGSLPCSIDNVLQNNCRTCHGPTPQFGAPMSMMTYADLHAPMKSNPSMSVYEGVGMRITNNQSPMPPPPNARLSTADTNTLEAWIAQGAPAATGSDACEGSDSGSVSDASMLPIIGGDSGYGTPEAKGPSDCVNYYDMQAHGMSSTTDTTGYPVTNDTANQGNEYVCFYFDPPYPAGSQGLWFSPIIDKTQVLHHWLLYASNTNAGAAGTVQKCQAVEPGWYLIAGWAPGALATNFPPDVGLQMPPTTGSLILQVHYYDLQNLMLSDRSGVRFCTAPANTRQHTATVTFTGSEGICIPPHDGMYEVSGNCQPTTTNGDIHIVSAWPHMHLLGNRMQINITRVGGAVETLHDAPFSFKSQEQYPVDVVIHPGDTIQTNCFYDNSMGSMQVPFGENTQDEMCYGFLTAWPANALVTAPQYQTNPVNGIANFFQQQTRCLDNVSIFQSCNGLADYPLPK